MLMVLLNLLYLLVEISVNTTDKYTLYLWFNGKDYDNPDTMQNNNILFELYATGENAILSE